MPQELVVPNNQMLDLDANPPPGALQKVPITTFNDLVLRGFVDSAANHCGHLLIEHTGKIVVKGTGLYIKAASIQGRSDRAQSRRRRVNSLCFEDTGRG
jgi:hypothetical protein